MKPDETIQLEPRDVLPYAVSLALHEAANRGWMSMKRADAIQQRMQDFYTALLDGKVLTRQLNGLYTIEDMPEDEDTLVVGDKE